MVTKVETSVPCWPITQGPKHHFFGYYDKSPWDTTGRYVLAMEVDFNDRLPSPDDLAVIGLVDLDNNNRFEPVAETRAWNWQQGCMLQWVPSMADKIVIYNDRQEERFISILLNIETGERTVLPRPVGALTLDGCFGLSIDFARLNVTRKGYGYEGVSVADRIDLDNDGIHLMNLKSGQTSLIVSYSQVMDFNYRPIMRESTHWFNHLLVNPKSTRFLFLHRFTAPDGGMYTRLFTANLDGSELFCLAEGMVSHYCWRNAQQIFAWGRHHSLSSQSHLRKFINLPFLRWAWPWIHKQKGWVRQQVIGDRFLLFTDQTNQIEPVGVLKEDAHPTYSPDGRWIIMDRYPDDDKYRSLLLYDWMAQKPSVIARFYSPITEGGFRCDLHSRWSRNGKQVCIDSAHEGDRQMYVLDVSSIVNKG